MKSFLRITAVAMLLCVLVSLVAAQSGSGPIVSLSYPVLPTQPTNLRTTATQFLWDYDFTQPNSRACTTTVTTACVTGFTVQTINQTTGAVIAGPPAVALPATISSTGPTIGIASPFTPPTALGSYAVQVTVNWKQ